MIKYDPKTLCGMPKTQMLINCDPKTEDMIDDKYDSYTSLMLTGVLKWLLHNR